MNDFPIEFHLRPHLPFSIQQMSDASDEFQTECYDNVSLLLDEVLFIFHIPPPQPITFDSMFYAVQTALNCISIKKLHYLLIHQNSNDVSIFQSLFISVHPKMCVQCLKTVEMAIILRKPLRALLNSKYMT